MEHVRQTELIQLAADELADPRRAEVERHLAECSTCQRRYERQADLWRTLGQWTPEFTARDLLPGLERKLAAASVALHPFWSNVARVSRVAAAIMIGVGAGYGAAHRWQPTRPGPQPVAGAEVEEAAMDALGVQYIGNISPAGLYAVLQDVPADAEAGEGQL